MCSSSEAQLQPFCRPQYNHLEMLSAPVALATSWTRVSNHRSTSPQGGPGGPLQHPRTPPPTFCTLTTWLRYRGSRSLLTQCGNGSGGGVWGTLGLMPSSRWVLYVLLSSACEFCPYTPQAHPKQGLVSSCHKRADTECGQLPSCVYPPPFCRHSAKWGEPGFWSRVHLGGSPALAWTLTLDLS